MEKFLSRLERRFGRHAPSGLFVYLVGAWAFAYALLYFKPELAWAFQLEAGQLLRGEVWRIATFLLLPPSLSGGLLGPIITLLVLAFFYTMLTSLEAEWGALRLQIYYLIGVLGTLVAALLLGQATNTFLNMSLVLAFATVFPDYEILLFFVLPVKMKWLALLDAVYLVYAFVTGGHTVRGAIAAAMLNYLLFFSATLVDRARGALQGRRGGRSGGGENARLARFAELTGRQERKLRVCAKCGKSERDDPRLEFRVCDCVEKCGGKATEYCIEHARAH
jgi:hypothetical protein